MNANEKLLTDLFDARPAQQNITNCIGTMPSGIASYMKAVWMCLIVPRSDTHVFVNGIGTNKNPISTPALSVDFRGSFTPEDGRVTVLENYIAPKNCTVFMDRDGKFTRVSVNANVRPTTAICMRIASAISKLLPWLFEGENKVTPEEYALLKQCTKLEAGRKLNADEFNRCETEFWSMTEYFINKYGYRYVVFERAAKVLTTDKHERELSFLTDKIQAAQSQINLLRDSIHKCLQDIEEYNQRIYYITHHDSAEVMQEISGFLKSGGFRIENIDGDTVKFTVFTTLSCYDEGMVDQYVLNEKSVLDGDCRWYRCPEHVDVPYSNAEMIAFYRAVFVDYRFNIKLAASYDINTKSHVNAKLNTTEQLDHDHINNPNICYAGCLGGYADVLTQSEFDQDFIAAFSICQQSASSVNLGEVWPMGRITQELVESTGKVIHTENGDITFKEAMDIIRAEQEEK